MELKRGKIFLDMDGVLVDFNRGTADALNKCIQTGETHGSKSVRQFLNYSGEDKEPITQEFQNRALFLKDTDGERSNFMKKANSAIMSIAANADINWWLNLPMAEGARELIDHCIAMVGVDNVQIMTAPFENSNACIDGKIAWINRYFPMIDDVTNMHISGEKGDFVDHEDPASCILIDDRVKYCNQWSSAGGTPVLHTPPASLAGVRNSINECMKILLDLERR